MPVLYWRCWTIPILPMLDLAEDSMATNTWELKYKPIVELEFEALLELLSPIQILTCKAGWSPC
jgi:hypothetical protein